MPEARPWRAEGRPLVPGRAEGEALVLDAPLSFWGGLDAGSGRIVDARHPQRGLTVAGRVLAMPAGRGSSSSSSVLAEALHGGHGPAAVVLARADQIVVLGALVVGLLYGLSCPVLELAVDDHARLRTGDQLSITADGRLLVIGRRALT